MSVRKIIAEIKDKFVFLLGGKSKIETFKGKYPFYHFQEFWESELPVLYFNKLISSEFSFIVPFLFLQREIKSYKLLNEIDVVASQSYREIISKLINQAPSVLINAIKTSEAYQKKSFIDSFKGLENCSDQSLKFFYQQIMIMYKKSEEIKLRKSKLQKSIKPKSVDKAILELDHYFEKIDLSNSIFLNTVIAFYNFYILACQQNENSETISLSFEQLLSEFSALHEFVQNFMNEFSFDDNVETKIENDSNVVRLQVIDEKERINWRRNGFKFYIMQSYYLDKAASQFAPKDVAKAADQLYLKDLYLYDLWFKYNGETIFIKDVISMLQYLKIQVENLQSSNTINFLTKYIDSRLKLENQDSISQILSFLSFDISSVGGRNKNFNILSKPLIKYNDKYVFSKFSLKTQNFIRPLTNYLLKGNIELFNESTLGKKKENEVGFWIEKGLSKAFQKANTEWKVFHSVKIFGREIDVVVYDKKENRMVIVELKSTYIKENLRDRFYFQATPLRKAQFQLGVIKKKLSTKDGISMFGKKLELAFSENLEIEYLIVSNSTELDLSSKLGFLKIDLFTVITILRNEVGLVNHTSKEREKTITLKSFIETIRNNDVWSYLDNNEIFNKSYEPKQFSIDGEFINIADKANDIGNEFLKQQEFGTAIKYFNSAIKIDPYHRNSLANRGILQCNCKNYVAALKDFKSANNIESDPNILNYIEQLETYLKKK